LVSLPKVWITKHNVKKGNELDVKEQGNKVVISTESMPELETKMLDVTGMDRTSIVLYLRSAYRRGYDTIDLSYNEPTTTHLRTGQKMKISSVIHEEVSRLVGVEIIKQKGNSCLVKSISDASAKDFNNILRRVFILIEDVFTDIVEGIKTENANLLETVEEKYDNITKFISYSFRLLNKKGYEVLTDITSLYSIVASMEETIEILKWVARDALSMKKIKFTDKGLKLIEAVKEAFYQYYDLFYKFDNKKVVDLYENRHETLTKFKGSLAKIPIKEAMIIANMTHILTLIVTMTEIRMGIRPMK
jgi:phosphate uptake regulator